MTDVQYVVAVAGKLADLFKGQGTLLGDAVDLRVRQDHGMIPALPARASHSASKRRT